MYVQAPGLVGNWEYEENETWLKVIKTVTGKEAELKAAYKRQLTVKVKQEK